MTTGDYDGVIENGWEFIRANRIEAEVSIYRLAKFMGCKSSVVSSIESGLTPATSEWLFKANSFISKCYQKNKYR